MARTPLFSLLTRALRQAAAASSHEGLPTDEAIDAILEHRASRRSFLKSAAAGSALIGASSALGACSPLRALAPERDGPRIVIVGAGLAGLTAAYYLKRAGYAAQIVEASPRIGGRCYTAKNFLGKGLTTELGGEFFDSTHTDALELAAAFELPLYDCRSPEEAAMKEVYFFGGKTRSERDIIREFAPLATQIAADARTLEADSSPQNPAFVTLDRTPLSLYLRNLGARGWIYDLLEAAYLTEYGLELDEQSALNLVYLISTDTEHGKFEVFGESDERYKIQGGNQRLAEALADALSGQIETSLALEALTAEGSGYRLSLQRDSGREEVLADVVILTVPFTLLRTIDLRVELPPQKRRAIEELGYGANTKVFLGFEARVWRHRGLSGNFFSDGRVQCGWDNSRAQDPLHGGLTMYFGGHASKQAGGMDLQAFAAETVPGLSAMFPGCAQAFTGKVARFDWPTFPFAKASYAAYKPGQWATISGHEVTPVGNLYFAGEHCSAEFQGFMNGAMQTGREAAESVLARFGRGQIESRHKALTLAA